MKDNRIQKENNLQLYKMKQKLKEKGITLIALVVTIIILLILVGVTISQIAGSNGLFQRARQAVEKYKNAEEEEQIQIGMLEQYVSDFSVVGGDEGESKASVTIKEFTVSGDAKNKEITVKVTVIGEASKVEYSIDNGITWKPEEGEEVETEIVKEGAEEKETEYTYIFKKLTLGKSYFARIKVYDANEKNIEVISDIVTLSYTMTAEEKDVLETKTFLGEDGTLKNGAMKNNGSINEVLNAGQIKNIPAGYTSGGTITAGTDEVESLEKQCEDLQKKVEELENKKVKKIDLGEFYSYTANKIDVSSYEGYKEFSLNNFIVANARISWKQGITVPDNRRIRIVEDGSYDRNNGILTTAQTSDMENGWSFFAIYSLYLLIGEIE